MDDVLKMRFAKVDNFEKCSTSCGGDSLFADSTGCPNEWHGSFYASDFQLNLAEVNTFTVQCSDAICKTSSVCCSNNSNVCNEKYRDAIFKTSSVCCSNNFCLQREKSGRNL